MRRLVSALFLALLLTGKLSSQAPRPIPAVPLEPIAAILDAFRTHQIVALGEGTHGGQQDHAFLASLIRDPRFSTIVNDIVVECGNARYQALADRFVRGEDVDNVALRRVWEDTTAANTTCDLPVYGNLFTVVRNVNSGLPRDRQLRILLGDPPIDWSAVRSFDDYLNWGGQQRDQHPADLIRREVLAKGRRALVTYGQMHFQRKNERTNFEAADFIVGVLEAGGAARIFNVWTVGRAHTNLESIEPNVGSWPVPSLALVQDTILGKADFSSYLTSDGRFTLRDGKPRPIGRQEWALLPMEDQFNAVLHLGRPSTITIDRVAPERCADSTYLEMRVARMKLVSQPADGLRRYCASVAAPAK